MHPAAAPAEVPLSTARDTRIRDLFGAILAFVTLAGWLVLWGRHGFAVGSVDSFMLWHVGAMCRESVTACVNGFFPVGYPWMLGRLFADDGVYLPTLLNLGVATVAVAAFGHFARGMGAGLLATIIGSIAFAVHPSVAYAATNPGPNAIALLLLLLAGAAALEDRDVSPAARGAAAGLLAGAAGLFRSEVVLLVPAVAAVAAWRGAPRVALAAALGAWAAALSPQLVLQAMAGQWPWQGVHGFGLWLATEPDINWHRLDATTLPSVPALVARNPAGAVQFWAGNLALLAPWVIAVALPAWATRAEHRERDVVLATVALVWAAWAATDDVQLGALVLAPLAALQLARGLTDLRESLRPAAQIAVAALFAVIGVGTGVRLYLESEVARKARNNAEEIEALVVDSGARSAREVFVIDSTRYFPTLEPHIPLSPGAWLQVEGALAPGVWPDWCAADLECFIGRLVDANVRFLVLDDSVGMMTPALAYVQDEPLEAPDPHPCLEKATYAGRSLALAIMCVRDPETGAIRRPTR